MQRMSRMKMRRYDPHLEIASLQSMNQDPHLNTNNHAALLWKLNDSSSAPAPALCDITKGWLPWACASTLWWPPACLLVGCKQSVLSFLFDSGEVKSLPLDVTRRLRFCSFGRNESALCFDALRGSLNTMQMRTQTKWSHATWQNMELWRGAMEGKEETKLETDVRWREKAIWITLQREASRYLASSSASVMGYYFISYK